MKYALFEFTNEKACEVGETRWILRENPDTFKNVGWDDEKDVMVAWPCDFTKIHKKIIKGSLDPEALETKTCVAKVKKFSGKSESVLHWLYGSLNYDFARYENYMNCPLLSTFVRISYMLINHALYIRVVDKR